MAWNGHLTRARVSPSGAALGPQRQLIPPHALPSPDAVAGISRARFPETYQAAHKALERCSKIDECKSWSDKAAAMASYARQAKDRTLLLLAERIHARAVRRCGELLKEIPSGQGSKNQHGELRDGAVTRQKAARDAGLSERQRVTALRLATLPSPAFEALMESEAPPTVSQLAEIGRHPRVAHRQRSSRDVSARVWRAREVFKNIREFCELNKPAELASEFTGADFESLRAFVAALHVWLDQFTECLPREGRAESLPKADDS